MSINLIVFLTHNDMTVKNAAEVFNDSKAASCNYWGIKDTGIDETTGAKLAENIKTAGKTFFYESLASNEEGAVKAAKFAARLKAQYLIGLEYFEKAHEILKENNVKFAPTCGKRSGIPRMLHGTIDEVIEDGKRIQEKGVDGLCLSVYRFTGGNPEELAERFINKIEVPVIITGSINNEDRLNMVKKLKPWGFTVGSAFFNHDFGKDLSFAQQIDTVVDFLKK